MNSPKISVITPSFNQGEYLEETILSVLNQKYSNLEYIIIDGGSEDSSVEIIKKYSSRINYWISEKDNGQSAAINKGFKKCTGDIVAWLNSDDCYLEGTLQKVAQYFSEGNHALIFGKTILYGEKRKEMVKGINDYKDIILKCLSFVPFPQPSTFFKRQVLIEQGNLDETLHYAMDYDLFARIALNYDMLGVDDTLSRYRLHESSKSNFYLKFAQEGAKVFSKVLRSFPKSENYVTILRELGCYAEEKDRYQVTKHFEASELKRVVMYFLEARMQYSYQGLDMKNSKTIARFLINDADYSENKSDAKKIYLRSSLLNKHFVSFLRRFTYN